MYVLFLTADLQTSEGVRVHKPRTVSSVSRRENNFTFSQNHVLLLLHGSVSWNQCLKHHLVAPDGRTAPLLTLINQMINKCLLSFSVNCFLKLVQTSDTCAQKHLFIPLCSALWAEEEEEEEEERVRCGPTGVTMVCRWQQPGNVTACWYSHSGAAARVHTADVNVECSHPAAAVSHVSALHVAVWGDKHTHTHTLTHTHTQEHAADTSSDTNTINTCCLSIMCTFSHAVDVNNKQIHVLVLNDR